MGGKQSQPAGQNLKIDHPLLKNAFEKKTANNQSSMVCRVVTGEASYKTWETKLKSFKPLSGSHLLPLSHGYKSAGMCGNTGFADIEFPFSPHLLENEITKRNGDHNYFVETELWYLLHSLAEAQIELKGANIKGTDVKPLNILLTEQGTVQLLSQISFPEEKSIVEKAIEKENVLGAPEVLKLLKSNTTLPHEAQSDNSDAFSLGMTMIVTGLLEPNAHTQVHGTMDFDNAKFDGYLQRWLKMSSYSNILRVTVWNMVQPESERLTVDELWGMVQKHSKKIQAQEVFEINNAPQRIHNLMGRFMTQKN